MCLTKLIKVALILASETSGTSLKRQSIASHPTLQHGFLIKELQWNQTTFWFGLRNLYYIKRSTSASRSHWVPGRHRLARFLSFLQQNKETLNSLKEFSSPETNSCSRSPVVRRRNLRYSRLWWRGLKSWGKWCRVCHKQLPTFRKRFLLPLGSSRNIFQSTTLHISEDRYGDNKSPIVYFRKGREETGRSELQHTVLWSGRGKADDVKSSLFTLRYKIKKHW